MKTLNERYFFEEDMLPVLGSKTRSYDMRGIMIPRIGDLLYYDTMDRLAIVEEVFDETYYNERYIPIGVIAHISEDNKTLKLVTPYIINVSIPMDKKRILEKTIIKDLKKYIKTYTKNILKEELEDLKFELTTEQDMEYIKLEPKRILNGIEVFSKYTNLNNGKQLDDIVKEDILLYVDKETLKIQYGIIDIVNNDFTDMYEQVSLEDIMLTVIKYFNNLIQCDYVKQTPTLKELKQCYPKIEILSAYIIPFATIKLD